MLTDALADIEFTGLYYFFNCKNSNCFLFFGGFFYVSLFSQIYFYNFTIYFYMF